MPENSDYLRVAEVHEFTYCDWRPELGWMLVDARGETTTLMLVDAGEEKTTLDTTCPGCTTVP